MVMATWHQLKHKTDEIGTRPRLRERAGLSFCSVRVPAEMNQFSQPSQAKRGHVVARVIAVLVLLGAAIIGEPSHADPGDFQAMPGLWKIVTRTVGHGQPSVAWHCVDETPDPWVEFAVMPVPGYEQC